MPEFIDLNGKTFVNWTVLNEETTRRKGKIYWFCKCKCGRQRAVLSESLLSGKSKSCGCDKPGLRAKPFEHSYRRLKDSCNKRNINLTLTYKDFLNIIKIGKCHYCNNELKWNPYRHKHNDTAAYQLDRKDNNDGYTVENCVPCCKRCNWGKGDQFTYEEWKQVGELIKTWRK